MPITSHCLILLQTTPGLGLPLTVSGIDRNKLSFTATIEIDGKVFCRGKVYDNPSELRATLIASNSATYPHLYYQNKSLHDWGIV
ncbi:hypothetical protein [Actimicrobium sp. CCI2.3]|uniref:hypothetical protein n=1 Tax=Actimicrobium sp. CCI2.3 TaxID=3048616 RepID=UPI002AB56522|nr:hypothetical protein [Actimicrobium sp. CCI2.3]MDY7572686.1 hypothetical protein [Actimicrobium sp. CCI2.3]MEB0022206.1 hypothetical protein [Actimicrobium sp. CCI2.3]